ncbi:hypothetical protein QOZ80_5AG0388610 [Eleusine coracana subsp. coracana]|nr:hypothetical protein QOZ80_5AG0388610 [Eleusine coracana subsp. coracana]
MELVGPSLTGVMKDENGVTRCHPENEVRHLVRQLLAGAAGMHRVGLMHRDIKPDNVLVDAHGNLKLCDLGISRAFSDVPPYTNPVVARKYRAPELPLGSVDYDSRIDAWAIGCIMAELLAGGMPFRGSSVKEQLGEVLSVLGTDDIREWSGCPDRLPGGCGPTSFLRDLFPSPEMHSTLIAGRPTLSEAGFEVLSGFLRCNPEKRMSPARALKHRWFQPPEA